MRFDRDQSGRGVWILISQATDTCGLTCEYPRYFRGTRTFNPTAVMAVHGLCSAVAAAAANVPLGRQRRLGLVRSVSRGPRKGTLGTPAASAVPGLAMTRRASPGGGVNAEAAGEIGVGGVSPLHTPSEPRLFRPPRSRRASARRPLQSGHRRPDRRRTAFAQARPRDRCGRRARLLSDRPRRDR